MCGIAGLVSEDGGAAGAREVALLTCMLDALQHRGGDGRRITSLGSACFGFNRLALTSPGVPADQPHLAQDGRTLTVINGTLHDATAPLAGAVHSATPTSDCAAFAAALAQHGTTLLNEAEGPFALARFDNSTRTLLLARDLFGRKPLFHARVGRYRAFASSLRALHAIGASTRIDTAAVAELLRNGWCHPPRTLFAEIATIGAGEILEFDARSIHSSSIPWPEADATPGALLPLLEDSVARRLATLRRPAAVLLSGGLDSAAVLVAARNHGLPAFTFAAEAPARNESGDALVTARALGVPLHVVRGVTNPLQELRNLTATCGEPLPDPSTLQLAALARAAGAHATVLLSGDGGDELLAGYRRHRAARLALGPVGRAPAWLMAATSRCIPPSRLRTGVEALALGRAAFQQLAQLAPDTRLKGLLDARWLESPELTGRFVHHLAALGPVRAAARADLELGLRHGLMLKADRAAMAAGTEIWSPFLDRRVVQVAFALDEPALVRGALGKWCLRRELAAHLPRSITLARKRGFATPLAAWLAASERGGEARALLEAADEAFRDVLTGPAHQMLAARGNPVLRPVFWSALAIAVAHQTAKESARPANAP